MLIVNIEVLSTLIQRLFIIFGFNEKAIQFK